MMKRIRRSGYEPFRVILMKVFPRITSEILGASVTTGRMGDR